MGWEYPQVIDDKERVHVLLYRDDWDLLGVLFGKSLGRSKAVREIIRQHLNIIRAKTAESSRRIITSNDELANLSAKLGLGTDKPAQPE